MVRLERVRSGQRCAVFASIPRAGDWHTVVCVPAVCHLFACPFVVHLLVCQCTHETRTPLKVASEPFGGCVAVSDRDRQTPLLDSLLPPEQREGTTGSDHSNKKNKRNDNCNDRHTKRKNQLKQKPSPSSTRTRQQHNGIETIDKQRTNKKGLVHRHGSNE